MVPVLALPLSARGVCWRIADGLAPVAKCSAQEFLDDAGLSPGPGLRFESLDRRARPALAVHPGRAGVSPWIPYLANLEVLAPERGGGAGVWLASGSKPRLRSTKSWQRSSRAR